MLVVALLGVALVVVAMARLSVGRALALRLRLSALALLARRRLCRRAVALGVLVRRRVPSAGGAAVGLGMLVGLGGSGTGVGAGGARSVRFTLVLQARVCQVGTRRSKIGAAVVVCVAVEIALARPPVHLVHGTPDR